MARLLAAPALALALALAGLGGEVRAAEARPPVVVELFTAQGCESCPAAEALFNELAARDDLIALSFHVDYWDYAGWRDPLASREASERQRAYARRFGLNYLYTPQLVINGVRQMPAADTDAIEAALDKARAPASGVLVLAHTAEGLRIAFTSPREAGGATVWLVLFDRRHVTEVTSGDNAGQTLVNENVVRAIRPLAVWRGDPLDLLVPMNALEADSRMSDGCAVLVQIDGEGRILAAGRLWLPEG